MTIREISLYAEDLMTKAMESLPTHDMDGCRFHYNPTRENAQIKALAEEHGFTFEQVEDDLLKLWWERNNDPNIPF